MYVIQSKNGVMMNEMIAALVKKIICGILVHVIVSVIKHVKLTNI